MNLLFWRKKKESELKPELKPEPRVLVVLDKDVPDVLSFYDSYIEDWQGGRGPYRTAKYLLWNHIGGLFPETDKGKWTIEFLNSSTVHIVEDR